MKRIIIIVSCILLSCSINLTFAQKETTKELQQSSKLPENFNDEPRGKNGIRIVSYNVENLFDIYKDSIAHDEDFTPSGINAWTYSKYHKKLLHISKVLISIGGWEPPAIIGLCEIENQFVLEELTQKTPLEKYHYKIIHEESQDYRGIDVAMLYRPEKFKPITHKVIHIFYPFDTISKARDILYVKGIVLNKDTLHIFINHWKSKWGGNLATAQKRNYSAKVLRHSVDSLFAINPWSKIIIMGDFNDSPEDDCMTKFLNAKSDTTGLKLTDLYNLMYEKVGDWKIGTNKFQGKWAILDQFIVSAALFKNKKGLRITPYKANIFDAPFLLVKDEKYSGTKPFRTLLGPRYVGGFSDHLSIYMDMMYYK